MNKIILVLSIVIYSIVIVNLFSYLKASYKFNLVTNFISYAHDHIEAEIKFSCDRLSAAISLNSPYNPQFTGSLCQFSIAEVDSLKAIMNNKEEFSYFMEHFGCNFCNYQLREHPMIKNIDNAIFLKLVIDQEANSLQNEGSYLSRYEILRSIQDSIYFGYKTRSTEMRNLNIVLNDNHFDVGYGAFAIPIADALDIKMTKVYYNLFNNSLDTIIARRRIDLTTVH